MRLEGLFRLQYFYDVGEEIRLEELRALLGLEKPGREPGFRRRTPDYVRFERPPLEERLAALTLATGEVVAARLRYFEYGVISLEMELPFSSDWAGLVEMAARWVGADGPEALAAETVNRQLERVRGAIRKPAARPLSEDYTVIELRSAVELDGHAIPSAALLERYGGEIAQAVRGERLPLSLAERAEVLGSSMSYSPMDLLVVGYAAALVYDCEPDGAQPMLQLLEYANTQLLEFRHYDDLLTRVLADAQGRFAKGRGVLRQWRAGSEAHKLNALRLEIIDLTERTDNAIKFLSDMFYARAYKLASARIGVPDYRGLVEEKLRAAGELYRFMMDEFHQGRAFLLELMVVLILIVDLIVLFTDRK